MHVVVCLTVAYLLQHTFVYVPMSTYITAYEVLHSLPYVLHIAATACVLWLICSLIFAVNVTVAYISTY